MENTESPNSNKEKALKSFSVSLDRAEEPWIKAIEADKLIWENHGWDKEGKARDAYGVKIYSNSFFNKW